MKFITSHKLNIQSNGGFTLVETLVAISILIIAITATLGVAAASLANSTLAREQMTAYYLAQDVIEYIKNYRDTEYIKDYDHGWENFSEGITNKCRIGCRIDTRFSDPNSAIRSDKKDDLLSKNVIGRYGYLNMGSGVNTTTSFKRIVTVTELEDYELKISVDISIENKGVTRHFTIVEHIFNWQ